MGRMYEYSKYFEAERLSLFKDNKFHKQLHNILVQTNYHGLEHGFVAYEDWDEEDDTLDEKTVFSPIFQGQQNTIEIGSQWHNHQLSKAPNYLHPKLILHTHTTRNNSFLELENTLEAIFGKKQNTKPDIWYNQIFSEADLTAYQTFVEITNTPSLLFAMATRIGLKDAALLIINSPDTKTVAKYIAKDIVNQSVYLLENHSDWTQAYKNAGLNVSRITLNLDQSIIISNKEAKKAARTLSLTTKISIPPIPNNRINP